MNSADVYRSAMTLVAECGDVARMHAELRRLAMRREGNLDGAADWLRVGRAIAEFQDSEWRPFQ
jgi:hypothetical protein